MGLITVLNSLLSALLMYSKIPVPEIEWSEKNRRYSLCFFPVVGVITGLLFVLWYVFCRWLGLGEFLFSAVGAWIPVAVTGGIHLDGFCDTSDALSSYADRERKLEIMTDSRVGAFAVIKIIFCIIIQTAFYSEIENFRQIILIGTGFVLSRSLSGTGAVLFKSAKKEGSLQDFVKPSHKKITVTVLCLWTAVSAGTMILVMPFAGLAVSLISLAVFAYYRHITYREFDGITGDTAGWFLQICETAIPVGVVIAEKFSEVVLN